MSRPKYRVEELPRVQRDYEAIETHIERWTGDRAMATRTVQRIRNQVKSLGRFPHRAMRRDDLRSGLRVLPFKSRTAIAFEIDEDRKVVTILRVFYGGQDYEAIMGHPPGIAGD